MCCASFVCSPMRARTRVSSRRFQSNSALSDADKTQSGPPDTLLGIISAHATSTALPALLAKHPSLPPSPSPDRDLDRGARLTRSYPSPSPICLHADLSALYLYQVVHQPLPPPPPSPPTPLRDRRRIDTAARWLSARSAHLRVCVSRLLEVQPPPPLTCRVCFVCRSFCFSFLGKHSFSVFPQKDCSVLMQLALVFIVLTPLYSPK